MENANIPMLANEIKTIFFKVLSFKIVSHNTPNMTPPPRLN